MKICNNCKKTKETNEFYKQKDSKDGYRNYCKACFIIKQKNYYDIKNSHITKKNKRTNIVCEDKKEYGRIYYEQNKKVRIKSVRKWQKKVKDDPFRKMKNRIKSAMRQYINKDGRKTLDLLGYSKEDLLNHLKSNLPDGVTWEYFLDNGKEFHIDHIIPQSLYKNEKEYLEKGWNLRNLRIISAKDNITKKDSIITSLIEGYNIKDLLPS
ncbi:MAG: hypothetical protein DRJ01_00470 [Bacteroidetes bacterium]|nr:MAG: hypothetical protein DRJ01_00470 [Bacteroidota bacterium]